jgi:Cys-tRNA(Pro)/Cys-tRNA(Cys) deacylase
VIPANAHLNLKKVATVSDNKSCEMLPMKDLLTVTGYIRGGCSPIGMKKTYPTYIEEMASLENEIIISAGKKGSQLVLKPEDLKRVINGKFADLSDF